MVVLVVELREGDALVQFELLGMGGSAINVRRISLANARLMEILIGKYTF